MDTKLLGQFDKELKIEYRGEIYRVRDNGSVCRQRRSNRQKRPLDEVWTFGTPSACTGYMHINSVVVHRIIATAFYGEQPSDKHIVDHIDTNRRNNRAENLRWITRLDNLLQNPITLRRITMAYGSLDEFFKNPRAPINPKAINNFEWMRTDRKKKRKRAAKNSFNGPSPIKHRKTEFLASGFMAHVEMNRLSRRDRMANHQLRT